MKKTTLLLSASLLCFAFLANGQNPVMLKDVNSSTQNGGSGTQPNGGVTIGSTYYFNGNSNPYGSELMKTDGTTATIVKDIFPGGQSSNPNYFKVVGSTIFFIADDGINGNELWMCDGTSTGTKMLFNPDVFDSPNYLTVVGTSLYLSIANNNNGWDEIYKVDASGNILLVHTPEGNPNFYPYGGWGTSNFTAVGNTLFFAAYAYDNNSNWLGYELLKTDGTEQGTVLVKDIYPGGSYSNPDNLTAVGSTLFFMAFDQYAGYSLFKSNGTPNGTVLVSDLNPSGDAWVNYLTALNGKLVFWNYDYQTNTGAELWTSDGTLGGTHIVSDIYPGSNWSNPYAFSVIGSTLYFGAEDATNSGLFKTDGTSAGTAVVSYECSLNGPIVVAGNTNTLYFSASSNLDNTSSEVWKSDGNSATTKMVKDIYTGAFNGSDPDYFGTNGTVAFFQANDPATVGVEMFRTDGTSAGTYALNLGVGITPGSAPGNLTKVGSNFFFTANDGIIGNELYMSDGSVGGTQLVKDMTPGATGFNFFGMMAGGSSNLYIYGNNGTYGTELWKSDGTSSGTNVIDLNPGAASINAVGSGVFSNTFYFAADLTGGINIKLYKTDGTTAGTSLVKTFGNNGIASGSNIFTEFNGAFYFAADDNTGNGVELWKSDGTSPGTIMVKDINASGSSSPSFLKVVGSKLLFFANDGIKGKELWISDGTPAGTQIVYDINTNTGVFGGGANVSSVAVLGSNIYFDAYTNASGQELWTSDGTFAGTKLVNDISLGVGSSNISQIVASTSQIFFRATNPATGNPGLFGSDGTSAGTTVLTSVSYDPYDPQNLVTVGSLVVFKAEHGYVAPFDGYELWVSDGTNVGTYQAADIYGGGSSSSPGNIINMNDQYVAFTADNGFAGSEVWKFITPAVVKAASLGSVLCAGNPFNVTYTVTQGILNPGNKFNVELSDGLGDFSSATILNSVTGVGPTGSISVTVPSGTSGLGYRLRIASTDQPTLPTAWGTPYIVADAPVTVWGNTSFCPGTPTTLTATGAVSYVWSGMSTGTTNTISVGSAGALTVTSTDAYGCTKNVVTTITQDVPPVVVVSGNTSYCLGSSTTLEASGAITYSWSPTTGLSDANAASVVVNGSSNQTYIVTGMGAACSTTKTVNTVVSQCGSGLGIAEPTSNTIQVYPNPATETLHVKMDLNANTSTTIKLVNTQGMLVYSETTTQAQGSYFKTIDMSKQAKGIYWLQVITNQGTTTNKVIVE